MNTIRLKKYLLAMLGLGFAALPSVDAAALTEAFDSPLEGVPSGWSVVTRSNVPNDGIVGIQEISESLGNGLRFQRPASGGQGSFSSGALYYTGTLGQFKDFTVEVTVRFASTGIASTVGMMLRAQSTSYAFSESPYGGYYVALGGTGEFGIYENPSAHNSPGALLSSVSFTPLVDTDYILQVTVEGSSISAAIWNPADDIAEITSVSYGNAEDMAGYFGFRSGFGNSDQTAYFRDLTLTTAIPEPSTFALLSLMAGLFLVYKRKQRR